MATRFSIIVPIYKVDKYLEQCIDSVLKQSYADYELILVDDGSPDLCPIICDKYVVQDERIKVIHKQNEGLVRTRQRGVAEAKGEFLVFLDGDDWIHEDYLMEMADIIEKHDPDVICCGHISTDSVKEKVIPFPMEEGLYSKNRIKKEIFPILIENKKCEYFSPSVWAKCFRKHIYKRQQIVDCFVQLGEDMACIRPTMFHAQTLYVLKKSLYYYRKNPQSITNTKKAYDWDGPMLIGKHQEQYIDMGIFDFQLQNYRFITHNLFLVAISQFNRTEKYSVIAKEMIENINNPYYRCAIEKCRFALFSKGQIAKILLKTQWIFGIYVVSKIYK